MNELTLKELIAYLEQYSPETMPKQGFGNPHSYRGYYHCLAFEPMEGVTVAQMLEDAKNAIGSTYEGYKGGDYEMDGNTSVYIAHYGSTGIPINHFLLRLMFSD